jgi:alpha-beta hydrolase superfamily lysophospholipase
MDVEFIRFKASDGVELQGWLSKQTGDTAALHIHGMGGNGYENYFLDDLRAMYAQAGIAFFAIDTRGRGIVSDFRQGDDWKHAGSCFEIFEESAYDIEGALEYLRSHDSADIEKVILLAPTDMIAWAGADPEHEQNLIKAKGLLAEGKGEELVGAQCWPLDKTPLSAQAYLSKSNAGAPVDIYGAAGGEAPLAKITQPVLIPYGSNDIGITHPFGAMDVFRERLDGIKNSHTTLAVIDGSEHGFRGYEDKLVSVIRDFITA